jgi:hypothetical protein
VRHALALLGCLGALGCQVILGFEEHEPYPATGGSGGLGGSGDGGTGAIGGGGSPTTGGAPAGGAPAGGGGEGGQGGEPPVELDLFEDPVELHTGQGTIEHLEMASDGTLFFLSVSGTHSVVRRTTDGTLTVIESGLNQARGLALTDGHVITATAPTGAVDPSCHVFAIDKADVAPTLDLVNVDCEPGQQILGTVGAVGSHVVFSTLQPNGNLRSRVFRAEATDVGSPGVLIGYGILGTALVPSTIVEGDTYYWVDSAGQRIMSSAGTVVSMGPAPGAGVATVTQQLAGAREVVKAGSLFFVATTSGIFRVDGAGDVFMLTDAVTPRGLSVDGSFLYWAEPTEVRAVRLSDLALSSVATAGDGPTSTATDGTAVFFGTSGGRIVRVEPSP